MFKISASQPGNLHKLSTLQRRHGRLSQTASWKRHTLRENVILARSHKLTLYAADNVTSTQLFFSARDCCL